ncbi:PREDICTED: uncharacterized protein LOC105462107 [Wasmannia auropunctata]|uniref:uncharacterized protein LOC105462107 n=1 Tax=Wasmannia auropunctata TaxID=64793 RepID=UPI0005EEF3E0|nr:PREDICTED: uncharacterized protein LOC105462107 [Wasmannia auropunctata]
MSRSHEKNRLCPEESFNTDTRKIPVLIRIHHSLGDGEAIIGLLFKAIIEEDEMKTAKAKIKGTASSGETEECFKSLKQQVKISTNNMWLNHKVIALKQLNGRIKEITRLTMALLSFPKYFIQQALRSTDENYRDTKRNKLNLKICYKFCNILCHK